jgi:hypothetical protein
MFGKLIKNLALLIVIGLVLLVLFPTQLSTIFQLYGALFGPFLVVIILVAALPRRRRRRY